MSFLHRQSSPLRDEVGLQRLLGPVDETAAMHLHDGGRAARRYLCATMLASALSGGAVVVSGELWINGAHEAVVLFALFVAVCFYVLADTGFGELALKKARQDPR